jgi:hypothetical protein
MESRPPDKKMPPPWSGDIEREVQKKLWPERIKSVVSFGKKSVPTIIALAILVALYWPYSDKINLFVFQVRYNNVTLLEGSAATVALLYYQTVVLKNPMSRPWWVAVFLLFILFGCFQAWEKEYLSRVGREMELTRANMRADTAYRDGYQKGKSDQIEVEARSSIPESPDSLRRRAKKLADDIDEFWDEAYASTIPRTNGVPNATGEQAEVNKRWNDYIDGRMRLCLSRFGIQITGIPKEMAAKGISMFWLDKFERGNNLRCLYGGSQGSAPSLSGSETEILRALSYRLDARGNPVQF